MRKLLHLIIVIVFLIFIAFLGYVFYSKWALMSFRLAPPASPPAFSVSYLFNFYGPDPEDEIENDVKNIKNAGFEGIKINYHFHQDNLAANKVAAIAAKNRLYPIGQFTGHSEKPQDRPFTTEELADWENFVRDEVRLNKDRVYFWEVWNEPSMTELFRYGTPAEYLELLKRTQKIVKEENPLAKVIVTADYTDTQAETFTNEFLALGGADYLDYLSFHPYNAIDPKARYNLAETFAQEEALAKKYNKPLWITEIGTPDSDSGEARQAEVVLTLFQTASENKIPIVWFHWSDRRLNEIDGKTGWGIVREDNTFKSAYETIKSFIYSKERDEIQTH